MKTEFYSALKGKNAWGVLFLLLLTIHHLLFPDRCPAEEQTVITSETLDYEQASSTYIAKGKANIRRGQAVLDADEIRYSEKTSDAVASGNVRYDDPEVSIRADKAELNMETKDGALYEAEILFKQDNYHIYGKEIKKTGEDYYFSPDAVLTTCDAPSPPWCFRGKNVKVRTGDVVKAKGATFRLLDVPVLYTPYFQAPIVNERKTGFLTPVVGYSNSRGVHLNVPFFLVLSENRDATLVLDEYSQRGLGEGLEYRYLEVGDAKGKWWVYHINDRELDKEFFEFRVLHEQRSSERIGGFLHMNIVNKKDFYREYSLDRNVRISRFLESTGEISLPFYSSRAYLLSQYWIDLKQDTKTVSQRMPEAGYVLNPIRVGDFWFSGVSSFTHFLSEDGIRGQRFDIFPRVQHSFGDEVTVSQSLGLRETAYDLQEASRGDSSHREAVEYDIMTHTRLTRKYGPFTHIFEPSLGYRLISDSENKLPTLDSTELFRRTSLFEFALLNRFFDRSGEILVLRVSQSYDTLEGADHQSLPLRLEAGMKKPLSLRFEATYDLHTGRLENTNADLSTKIWETVVSLGQRYNMADDTSFFNAGIGLHPFKSLYIDGKIWYDVKGKEARDAVVNLKYISQCWGIDLEFVKRPGDFDIVFRFELKGLTRGFKS